MKYSNTSPFKHAIVRTAKLAIRRLYIARAIRFVCWKLFTSAVELTPLDCELWFWIREFVTYFPGSIGVSLRKHFYNSYLKRGSSTLLMLPGAVIESPGLVELGDYVSIARNAWINGDGDLKIGNHSGIGPGAVIHTANHNYSDPHVPFKEQGRTYKPVIIEDDVWLAAGVIVLPGTHIGRGAIIVAGSVVSGEVQPMAVMAGFPARKIGTRDNTV